MRCNKTIPINFYADCIITDAMQSIIRQEKSSLANICAPAQKKVEIIWSHLTKQSVNDYVILTMSTFILSQTLPMNC